MNCIKRYQQSLVLLFKALAMFSLLFTAIASADMKQDIAQILNLLDQQKHQQAYQIALSKTFDYEGLVEFDYALGLSAQASGHFNQAIFAFERVVKNTPNWLLPRYALAASYFSAGNLAAAKVEFEQIKKVDNTKKFAKIDDYLLAIDNQESQLSGIWLQQLDLGGGYDSNANSGIDDEVINIPLLGNISLFESSNTLSDSFLQLQYQASYLKPINKNTRWYALGKIRYADYQDNADMSRTFADLFVGYQQKIMKNTYRISSFYRPLWLGSGLSANNKYLDYYGLTGNISRTLKKNHDYGAELTYALLDYQQADLDRDQLLAQVWYQLKVHQFTSHFSLSLGQENADDGLFKHLGRDFYGLSYRLTGQLSDNILVNAQLDYIRSNYQADHPLFVKTRNDSTFKASAYYQQYFAKYWSWIAKIVYIKNSSDLVLYDYDRTVVSTAIRYQF
ncbi:MAG: hypothetical protein COB35_07415 [Gammaproteobacteria bacterium]|nr:MAG: hypothetical protein COB35_07415 [Gammaproteobacteria bacterium]